MQVARKPRNKTDFSMKKFLPVIAIILFLSCSQTTKTATAEGSKSNVEATSTNVSTPDEPARSFSGKSARLTGKVQGIGGYWLYLVKPESWAPRPNVWDSCKVDGEGKFAFEIEAEDLSEFMVSTRGNVFTSVFLKNGFDIQLDINGQNNNRSFAFSGDGGNISSFWVEFRERFLQRDGFGTFYQGLVKENTPEAFKTKWQAHMDRQKSAVDSFMKSKPRPDKSFKKVAYNYIKYGTGGKLLTYLYHKPQISQLQNTRYIQVKETYYDFLKDYDLEKEEYLVNTAMNDFLYSFIIDKEMTGRFSGKPARTYAFEYAKNNLKGEVRDAAAGHLLIDFITNANGDKEFEQLKQMIDEFNDFAGAKYVSFVKKKFKSKAVLIKGAPAPDFTLENLAGEMVSLSDYKGKLVVIDFWGTWCGPCRRELPYSKKIEEKYKDNDDVVFVFVALERGSKDYWKQFVNQNKIPGEHLYSRQDRQLVPYKIESVPRYVLIGKDGNIYNAFASRPSQNMEQQIAKALSES